MRRRPLNEQVIVVVGAATGMGRVVAEMAASAGAEVVAVARDGEALASLPDSVAIAVGDVTDRSSMVGVAERAVARFGRIDSWVHVAGVVVHGRAVDTPTQDFRDVLDVDLLGVVHGAQAAVPHLARTRGALVVVTSITARRAFPLVSAYSAAKHGAHAYLEALRVELRHDGVPVTVCEVLPQTVSTPLFERSRSRLGVRGSAPPPVLSPDRAARMILRAVERPRRDVPVAVGAFGLLALQRLSPRLVDRLAHLIQPLMSSRELREPEAPDAVAGPIVGDDRVHGVVTNLHR
jgi:NAD(P)-dependent dehydrogenase (short-subunit alcohol dehydrogenase family)